MAEGRAPISSSRIATGDVARHSFAVVRRGFDTDEVRSYLQSVSRSIEALEEREQELRTALAEAEERAAHPVVDETTLTASLGQRSAQILRHAHEEAARIVAQAQEGAATLLREAQAQADELQARSEAAQAERVGEVELLVANAQHEARVEGERIIAEAEAEGESVVARAKDEGRELVEQAQEARRRTLADLAARRRTIGMQIEALAAARDEMTASVEGVRDRVEGILDKLNRTDDEARAAAMAVTEHYRLHVPAEGATEQDATSEGLEGAGTGVSAEAPTGPTPATGAGPVEGTGGATGGAGPRATRSVDELFARIRAGTEAVQKAGGPPARPPVPAVEADTAAAAAADTDADADKAAGAETGAGADTEAVAVVPSETAEEPSETAEEQEEVPAGPDDALVAQRDELLDPVTARLSRAVKRALGDDQNRLLEVLRNAPSLPVHELLGDESAHLTAFAVAARPHVVDAFVAGAAFAGADGAKPEDETVDLTADALANVVVTMLRRQIEEGNGDTGDRVGAAYREWRGERVQRLAGDYATQAFSAGVVATATEDKLRWVVTQADGCSDCEDNALAGTVSADEAFPTGHAHPPAHSGCRCLVTPSRD